MIEGARLDEQFVSFNGLERASATIGRGGAVILTGAPLMSHFEQALRAITSIGFPHGKDISTRATPIQIPDRSGATDP